MSTLIQKLDIEVGQAPSKAFTWMHISDMHFGHGRKARHRVDQRMVAREIIRDCERLTRRLGQPDAVFFTGDIAFRADPNVEYAEAAAWMSDLLCAVGVPPERAYLVPGNHDVDRVLASSRFTDVAIHKYLRQSPEAVDDLLESQDDLSQIWPKMSAYSEFAQAYGAPKLTPLEPFWALEIDTPVGPAVIAGLNTNLLSFDNSDSNTTLALGLSQISEAVHQHSNDRLLVVLMHHPTSWLRDGKKLESVLQNRPHILLCGHIHDQGGLIESPLHGHGLVRFVAGAGHVDEGHPPEHSYSWGQLSSSGLHYFPRIWVTKHSEFRGDRNTFADMDSSGRVTVTRDRLPASLSRWIPAPEPIFVEGVVEWLNDPRGHWHLTIECEVADFDRDRQARVTALIRDLSEDANVRLVAISDGSVNLIFEGSQEGFDRLNRLFVSDRAEFSRRLGVTVIGLEQVKGATLHVSSMPGDVGSGAGWSDEQLVHPSEQFSPVLPAGILLRPERMSAMNFIFTTGDDDLSGEPFRAETKKLLEYFQATLAVESDSIFVNLSAFESNRMISKDLAKTTLGKDMLRADCLLKRLSASLIHPQTELGGSYWDAVLDTVHERFGTNELPISTFLKVWVSPKEAVVYVHQKGKDPGLPGGAEEFDKFIGDHDGPSIFVSEAELEIKCEADHTAITESSVEHHPARAAEINEICISLYREVIVPVLEREANNGRYLSMLRQIYYSMVLAEWFKKNCRDDPHLSRTLDVGPSRVKFEMNAENARDEVALAPGHNVEDLKNEFYREYMRLFRQGVFHVVDRRFDARSAEVTTRTYVSGSIALQNVGQLVVECR